jgi:transcriptional regulator with XRE-family HTH domain
MRPFGKFVREIRVNHGLTLAQLAKKIGITAGYLSQLERSDTAVITDRKMLLALARATNTPLTRVAMRAFQSSGHAPLPVLKRANKASDLAVKLSLNWENLTDAALDEIDKIVSMLTPSVPADIAPVSEDAAAPTLDLVDPPSTTGINGLVIDGTTDAPRPVMAEMAVIHASPAE